MHLQFSFAHFPEHVQTPCALTVQVYPQQVLLSSVHRQHCATPSAALHSVSSKHESKSILFIGFIPLPSILDYFRLVVVSALACAGTTTVCVGDAGGPATPATFGASATAAIDDAQRHIGQRQQQKRNQRESLHQTPPCELSFRLGNVLRRCRCRLG